VVYVSQDHILEVDILDVWEDCENSDLELRNLILTMVSLCFHYPFLGKYFLHFQISGFQNQIPHFLNDVLH
jgi:hypothetical protein